MSDPKRDPRSETAGETDPAAEPQAPSGAEFEQLRAERDQAQDQLQRTMADLQNMRRRQGQELQENRRRTIEGLCHELLPVLDNFQMALAFWDGQPEGGPRDATPLIDGVRMVQTLLNGALERHGLQEIKAEGQPFDPNLHEAVTVENREGVPAGRILKVLQRGFVLGDRVIRPSRVVVSGDATAPGQEPQD